VPCDVSETGKSRTHFRSAVARTHRSRGFTPIDPKRNRDCTTTSAASPPDAVEPRLIRRQALLVGADAARRFGIGSVQFVESDLHRPGLRPASFDVVYSAGVLHHTADPRTAFERVDYLRTYPTTLLEDERGDLLDPAADDWSVESWLAQLGWMWPLGGEGACSFTSAGADDDHQR
jgi:hypothetical protein